MNFPDKILAGTLIKLGKLPGASESSVGLVVRTKKDIRHAGKGVYETVQSDVITKTEEWYSNKCNFMPNLKYDEIVPVRNTEVKHLLERLDD
jgi:hypothetical protein